MTIRYQLHADEEVAAYESADNGAGPMWCHGSSIITRIDDRLFVAGLITNPNLKPLNNCHWSLHTRDVGNGAGNQNAWREVCRDDERTREPSPIAHAAGSLLISANETLKPPNEYAGPSRAQVYRIDPADLDRPPVPEHPKWTSTEQFTEHSYRAFASNGQTGRTLLMHIQHHAGTQMSLRHPDGSWQPLGQLKFPWGADYPTPESIRLCYANVFLEGDAAHYFAVSDIIEPYPHWREAKFAITKQKWDYEFRRLFYTWTPNIADTPFQSWQEIASRDKTAGHTAHLDLHVDAAGITHLLWHENSLDARLRDEFFPGQPHTASLHHATMKAGREISRKTIALGDFDRHDDIPQYARLHIAADGKLAVIATFIEKNNAARRALRSLDLSDPAATWQPIPGAPSPTGSFMHTTPRAGAAPHDTMAIAYTQTEGDHHAIRTMQLNRVTTD